MFLPAGQGWVRAKWSLLPTVGPKIWNNLHSALKSAESVNNFKHKIKTMSLKTSKITVVDLIRITEKKHDSYKPAMGGPRVSGTDLMPNSVPTPGAILSRPTMSPVSTAHWHT